MSLPLQLALEGRRGVMSLPLQLALGMTSPCLPLSQLLEPAYVTADGVGDSHV